MTNRAKKNDAADTAASGEVGTETAEPTATPATPNEQQSGRNRRSQRLTAFTSVERLLLRLESEWSVVRFDEDGQYEMLPSGGADVIDQLTQVRDVLRLMLLEPISEMRAVIDAADAISDSGVTCPAWDTYEVSKDLFNVLVGALNALDEHDSGSSR